jgi:hypothetical protein
VTTYFFDNIIFLRAIIMLSSCFLLLFTHRYLLYIVAQHLSIILILELLIILEMIVELCMCMKCWHLIKLYSVINPSSKPVTQSIVSFA